MAEGVYRRLHEEESLYHAVHTLRYECVSRDRISTYVSHTTLEKQPHVCVCCLHVTRLFPRLVTRCWSERDRAGSTRENLLTGPRRAKILLTVVGRAGPAGKFEYLSGRAGPGRTESVLMLRYWIIEVHRNFSKAPCLRSSILHPETDVSKNLISPLMSNLVAQVYQFAKQYWHSDDFGSRILFSCRAKHNGNELPLSLNVDRPSRGGSKQFHNVMGGPGRGPCSNENGRAGSCSGPSSAGAVGLAGPRPLISRNDGPDRAAARKT